MIEKLEQTKDIINCWVDSWGLYGVYVAYSGGKDSEVLLHIVRSMYPEIIGVFSNTGLEFPEIVKHVKSTPGIVIIRPKMSFTKVIDKYGWPVISKEVACGIDRYRNTKDPVQKHYRLHGKIVNGKKYRIGVIPKKWQFMIDAPFKASEQCCRYLKKNPMINFQKSTNMNPMIGIRAAESNQRKVRLMKYGCNIYDSKHPQSMPLSYWSDEDIEQYITDHKVNVCSIYDMGYPRTGCIFCMFGLHQEMKSTGSNRFQKMKITHPKLYDYCINKLGAGDVLDFMNIPY